MSLVGTRPPTVDEWDKWNAVFADNWILADRLSGNVGSPELF